LKKVVFEEEKSEKKDKKSPFPANLKGVNKEKGRGKGRKICMLSPDDGV
jgi:hypothetical protein